ncbi:tyrosine--tRNA ligase [Acholeplasma hippikon]|uniref:Tyrosine--tRNA ligase n=1 Tax=Acholeplasma hippikon TaxID=264636 RepID=A0A449BL53_9MOLU|nr:tyrosine--tRNA ligase [Acholeplasma hippikon]VEU83198.1 tyrosyl tRNA synthetase [Acholeplasma hippikon]
MNLFDELVWRGMVKDVSNLDEARKMLNERSVKFYVGYDPTGESLTVGHMVQIVRMRYLQKHGHIPVVLIGGATGLIGDPRETSERKMLTVENSLHNAGKIEKQIRSLMPENTIFVNNYDWISKVDVISFLRDYGKNFNVAYMLAKDTVQKRIETGISYTEFSYMILQSMDWLHLYQTLDVKIQFGGSDQWGNITSGLELIRKVVGENDAVGLSSPLLLKADGTKFGKSESGALWLDKEMTSPYEMYQYFLNTSDNDIENYLKLLTLLEREEIIALLEESREKPELRFAQKRLAEEVVKFVHGEKELEVAQMVTDALFSGDFSKLDESAYQQLEKVLDVVKLNNEMNIVEALNASKLSSSNREAREFIQSGAVTVNGSKVSETNLMMNDIPLAYNKYVILRRGKKKYALGVF